MTATQATFNFRRTDPSTSAQAAEKHEASGVRESNKQILLRAIKDNPGMTSREAAAATGMDRVEAARRLPDLIIDKVAYQGGKRKCTIGNNKCVTWWPK
jgi:predicted HTH transcriptional regulator